MPVVEDKLLGKELLHDHPIKIVTSDPASGKRGQMILNSTEATIKVYWAGAWWIVCELPEDTSSGATAGTPMGLLLSLTYAS